MRNPKGILGVDFGTKYIGLCYVHEGSEVILPIGNVLNDGSLFFNIGDILSRYKIRKVVIGFPKQNEILQKEIDKFIKDLGFVSEEQLEVYKIDEEYTSVEAGAVTGDFNKNPAEDTIASMKILERYLEMIK